MTPWVLLGVGALVFVVLVGVAGFIGIMRAGGSGAGAAPQEPDRYGPGALVQRCDIVGEKVLTDLLGPREGWREPRRNRTQNSQLNTTTVDCAWGSDQYAGADQELETTLQVSVKLVSGHPLEESGTGAEYLKESFARDFQSDRVRFGARRVSGLGDDAYSYYEPGDFPTAVIAVRSSNITVWIRYEASVYTYGGGGDSPVPRQDAEEVVAYLAPRVLGELPG